MMITSIKVHVVTIATVVMLALLLLGRSAGAFLVLDSPDERGDAIVVLGGDQNDCRYHRAVQVLNDGKGRLLFVDSNTDQVQFGRTLAVQEQEFIKRSAGTLMDHIDRGLPNPGRLDRRRN